MTISLSLQYSSPKKCYTFSCSGILCVCLTEGCHWRNLWNWLVQSGHERKHMHSEWHLHFPAPHFSVLHSFPISNYVPVFSSGWYIAINEPFLEYKTYLSASSTNKMPHVQLPEVTHPVIVWMKDGIYLTTTIEPTRLNVICGRRWSHWQRLATLNVHKHIGIISSATALHSRRSNKLPHTPQVCVKVYYFFLLQLYA